MKSEFVYGVICLMVLVHVAEAWRCYFCKSDKSWDDCMANSISDLCKYPLNRCNKFFWEYKDDNGTIVQKYEKGCGRHFECDTCNRRECVLDKSRKCEIYCCLSDLCNAGSNSRFNYFLLWTPVLIGLIRLVPG